MVGIEEIRLDIYPPRIITDFLTPPYPEIFNCSQNNQIIPEPLMGKVEGDNKGLMRILVVDDDLIFGKNFTDILKNIGYTVELVNNGNAAVTELGDSHFDIVFLDIKLPDINGIEVLKKVKAIRPKTNVIVMTAFPFDIMAMEEVKQAGAFTYFYKPFDINAVLRAIKELSG